MFNQGRIFLGLRPPQPGVQRHVHTGASSGYTLIEILITVTVIGILTAIAAPLLWGFNKPTQNATARVEGILRQVRIRAMGSTTAYRVRRLSATQLQVEASSARGCEASTQLSTAANAGDTAIRVASTRGFAINDPLQVGSVNGVTIQAINDLTQTITITPALSSSQPVNSQVELENNWQAGNLVTTFSTADLTLPAASDSSQRIQLADTPPNWVLCFDSRGLANLYNPVTGRPMNGNLSLEIERVDATANTRIPNSQVGTITVFQGGGVNANTQLLDE